MSRRARNARLFAGPVLVERPDGKYVGLTPLLLGQARVTLGDDEDGYHDGW